MPAKKCVVTDCENLVENDDLLFFSFPFAPSHYRDADEKRYTELQRGLWVKAINNDAVQNPARLKYLVVCEEHFECGKPAHMTDRNNPDYVPHLNMGSSSYILPAIEPQQSPERTPSYRPGPKRFKLSNSTPSTEQQKEANVEDMIDASLISKSNKASQEDVGETPRVELSERLTPPLKKTSTKRVRSKSAIAKPAADILPPVVVDIPEDIHSSFGDYVASMLRSIRNKYLQSVARQQISQTLFKIEHVMQLSNKSDNPENVPAAAQREFKQCGLPFLAETGAITIDCDKPETQKLPTKLTEQQQFNQLNPSLQIQSTYSLKEPIHRSENLQTNKQSLGTQCSSPPQIESSYSLREPITIDQTSVQSDVYKRACFQSQGTQYSPPHQMQTTYSALNDQPNRFNSSNLRQQSTQMNQQSQACLQSPLPLILTNLLVGSETNQTSQNTQRISFNQSQNEPLYILGDPLPTVVQNQNRHGLQLTRSIQPNQNIAGNIYHMNQFDTQPQFSKEPPKLIAYNNVNTVNQPHPTQYSDVICHSTVDTLTKHLQADRDVQIIEPIIQSKASQQFKPIHIAPKPRQQVRPCQILPIPIQQLTSQRMQSKQNQQTTQAKPNQQMQTQMTQAKPNLQMQTQMTQAKPNLQMQTQMTQAKPNLQFVKPPNQQFNTQQIQTRPNQQVGPQTTQSEGNQQPNAVSVLNNPKKTVVVRKIFSSAKKPGIQKPAVKMCNTIQMPKGAKSDVENVILSDKKAMLMKQSKPPIAPQPPPAAKEVFKENEDTTTIYIID